MCRDNIYLIPYLFPDSWRSTARCTGPRSSHKQAGAARKAAGWVQCQGNLGANAVFWEPEEVAAREEQSRGPGLMEDVGTQGRALELPCSKGSVRHSLFLEIVQAWGGQNLGCPAGISP